MGPIHVYILCYTDSLDDVGLREEARGRERAKVTAGAGSSLWEGGREGRSYG